VEKVEKVEKVERVEKVGKVEKEGRLAMTGEPLSVIARNEAIQLQIRTLDCFAGSQ